MLSHLCSQLSLTLATKPMFSVNVRQRKFSRLDYDLRLGMPWGRAVFDWKTLYKIMFTVASQFVSYMI